MQKTSHIHSQKEWLKTRLNEMDASVAHFETALGQTKSMAGSKASVAVEDMKNRRDSLKHWVDQKEDQGGQAWKDTKIKVDKEWNAFENSVENFLEATQDKVKASTEAFMTRAASQKQSWGESIEGIKTAAATFTENRKAEVEKTTTKLDFQADKVGDALKGINEAGHASWPALRNALAESRDAFDHAFEDTKVAFKHANKNSRSGNVPLKHVNKNNRSG